MVGKVALYTLISTLLIGAMSLIAEESGAHFGPTPPVAALTGASQGWDGGQGSWGRGSGGYSGGYVSGASGGYGAGGGSTWGGGYGGSSPYVSGASRGYGGGRGYDDDHDGFEGGHDGWDDD